MFPAFDEVAIESATRGLRKNAPVRPAVAAEMDPRRVNQSGGDAARAFRRGLSAGDDLAGQSLWHYELFERIGAGGMGVVYKAQHRWLGRTVAIKFLTLELLDHPEGLVRFAHEALAIGSLDHPNIVRATDAGAFEGIHFLVTEFVEGPDLSKLVSAGQPLAPADACEIVRQAAVGLEHAHRCELIHRDIKPSNLIVHHDGTVKLLDFGLARLSAGQTTLTTTGQLVGTLDYLAPEQAVDSRSVDIRADIYSLGCTLYFLLSGRPPFAGLNYETAASKIRAHLADEPRPVAAGNRHVPLAVIDCLQRMMAKNPADRFATPGAVAAALAPLARGADLAGLIERSSVPGVRRQPKRPLADRIWDRMTLDRPGPVEPIEQIAAQQTHFARADIGSTVIFAHRHHFVRSNRLRDDGLFLHCLAAPRIAPQIQQSFRQSALIRFIASSTGNEPMIDGSQTRISQSLSVRLGESAAKAGANWLVRIYPADAIGELVSIADDRLLIGRDESCGLVLDDDSVSRRHALLEKTAGSFLVTDLDSTNGTYVNDERVTSHPVMSGDRLRLGNQIFKLLTTDHLETQYYETVYKMMTTDGLTQVYNKRYLLDVLERELARARRTGQPLSVLMLDIDHFKSVNDTHGHLAGDDVLQELCRRTGGLLRSDELLARYGGEEFAVVLADCSPDQARQVAERIRQHASATPFQTEAAAIAVTVSIGLASSQDQISVPDLLAAADQNLYAAKRGGRNRVVG